MAAYKKVFRVLLLITVLSCLKVFHRKLDKQLFSYPFKTTPTRHNDSCDILIKTGKGFYDENAVELRQLDVYFRTISSKTKNKKPLTSDSYSHSVDIACYTEQPASGIVIWIEERYLGNLTSGGSNFRVLFGTPIQQVCSYNDYFNGTYVVFCPAPVHGCIAVSIDILYVNFDAFRGNRVPLNALLWNNTLCTLGNGHCSLGHSVPANIIQRTALPVIPLLRRRVAAQNKFKWSKLDGQLQLSNYNSGKFEQMSNGIQPINISELCR